MNIHHGFMAIAMAALLAGCGSDGGQSSTSEQFSEVKPLADKKPSVGSAPDYFLSRH